MQTNQETESKPETEIKREASSDRAAPPCSPFSSAAEYWKEKYIQQNKDLKCEQMDPNGTIWDYAERIQKEMTEARRVLKHCRLFISERRGYRKSEEMERDAICADIAKILPQNDGAVRQSPRAGTPASEET